MFVLILILLLMCFYFKKDMTNFKNEFADFSLEDLIYIGFSIRNVSATYPQFFYVCG